VPAILLVFIIFMYNVERVIFCETRPVVDFQSGDFWVIFWSLEKFTDLFLQDASMIFLGFLYRYSILHRGWDEIRTVSIWI